MLKLNGREIVVEHFPNNETKVKDFEENVTEKGNILEFKYLTDADLISLMFVKRRIDELSKDCTLFLWYMPYSRMDRKIEGDLFTLQYVCQFINWLAFTKVVVMEPHSEKTIDLLERVKPVYPVNDWLETIKKEIGFLEEADHIVFPDKGAAARYAKCNYVSVCVLAKTRNPQTGKIEKMELVQGDICPGAKCIIIDDLCSKGGTFDWGASILKEKGASKVVLAVSHCEETIFQGKILSEGSNIDTVYTSTSMMNQFNDCICYMDIDVKGYVNQ